MLSDKHIDEFIAIYEREFGETITREEAAAMAARLVNLYRVLLRAEEEAARKKRDASL